MIFNIFVIFSSFVVVVHSQSTTTPQQSLPGGWSYLNESNADVTYLAEWSLAHLPISTPNDEPVLEYVSNIWTQVVEGFNYNFTVNYKNNGSIIPV